MAGYTRNLVLVHTPHLQARADFETIQAKLAERAPDIEVFIVNNDQRNSVSRRQAGRRPAFVFSPAELRLFRPVRGKVYAGRKLPGRKFGEVQAMVAGGVSVPETVMITPDTKLNPAMWGPFAVVKPNGGLQGRGVRLMRTKDVRWVDPMSWPVDDPRHGKDMMAQKFIDTGPRTACYRVLVVLGEVVYCLLSRATAPRPFALDPLSDEPVDQPIAANVSDRKLLLMNDRAVIEFGRRVQFAFPDIPVLGVDVIREEATGRLYALEVNAPGLTWSISSNYGLALQRKHGIDLSAQFDALEVISNALIDHTRRLAE